MEKILPRIIFTIMVLTGLAWAQTLSDIERYRKQYEDYLRSMQQDQVGFDLSEDRAIIGDKTGMFQPFPLKKNIKAVILISIAEIKANFHLHLRWTSI